MDQILTTPSKHIKRKHELPVACKASKDCDHRTAEPRDMYRHYWSTHKPYAKKHDIPGDEEFPCPNPKCNKVFTREDNMLRHFKNKKCSKRS